MIRSTSNYDHFGTTLLVGRHHDWQSSNYYGSQDVVGVAKQQKCSDCGPTEHAGEDSSVGA